MPFGQLIDHQSLWGREAPSVERAIPNDIHARRALHCSPPTHTHIRTKPTTKNRPSGPSSRRRRPSSRCTAPTSPTTTAPWRRSSTSSRRVNCDFYVYNIYIYIIVYAYVYTRGPQYTLLPDPHVTIPPTHRIRQTRLDFAAFVRACELQEGCKGLNLRAYLIMPVQRIPRYSILCIGVYV